MNDAARELIGKTVGGRFRLTGFLGEGAMASVYRGEQDGEPHDVAIKIMHPELLREASFAKRFTREAKAAARIEHRNTVRILGHGADGELLYLAMELCLGVDLFDLLARERRLSEARAVRIGVQICAALTAAHAHGIVHRDLKPENVMILPEPGEPGGDLVKVLDFGIAKIMERDHPAREEVASSRRGADGLPSIGMADSGPPSSALTMVGTLVGTPEYMSPEQALGQPVDARSDVYACGVLLFVMITGKPLFTGRGPVDVMMQHADKPPPAPSTLVPGMHPGLERTILKALLKSPDLRHQSAAELREELLAHLPDLPTSARRAPPTRASDPGTALLRKHTPSAPKIEIRTSTLVPDTLRSAAHDETTAKVDVVIKEAAAPEKKPPAPEKKPPAPEKKPAAGDEKKPAETWDTKPTPVAVIKETQAALAAEKAKQAALAAEKAKQAAPAAEKAKTSDHEETRESAGSDEVSKARAALTKIEAGEAEKPAPAPAPEKKPDAAADEEKKPATAVDEEKKAAAATDEEKRSRTAVTKPIRVGPVARAADSWLGLGSYWMIALAIAILATIVWLMRYLRLG